VARERQQQQRKRRRTGKQRRSKPKTPQEPTKAMKDTEQCKKPNNVRKTKKFIHEEWHGSASNGGGGWESSDGATNASQ